MLNTTLYSGGLKPRLFHGPENNSTEALVHQAHVKMDTASVLPAKAHYKLPGDWGR